MSAHAPLAPSSAHRWVECPFSVAHEARYSEKEESPSAKEGTAAHWVLERALAGARPTLGDAVPNGLFVTQEMLEGAVLAAEEVCRVLGDECPAVEQQVTAPRIHAECWGTPDLVAWSTLSTGAKCLHVWDYKFGHGLVEVFENWQLITYAAGLLGDMPDQDIMVDLAIIQPRAFHRDGPVRYWRVTAADLRPYINKLAGQAEAALRPDAKAKPTSEGCKHCRGAHSCEALQRAAYLIADEAQAGGSRDLSAHAFGLELKKLKEAQSLLDARVSSLEAEAMERIRRGERIPFWFVDSTPGRKEWSVSVDQVRLLGQGFGLEMSKPREVVTPTQAASLAKNAGLPPTIFDSLTERKPGSLKLTFDKGEKAALIFGEKK